MASALEDFESDPNLHSTRELLLETAREWAVLWRQGEFVPRMHRAAAAGNMTVVRSMCAQLHWHETGLQSVEVSHKLAAALMATSSAGALEGQRLPWPAFEVRIPPGLLESSHGEVHSVLVSEPPSWIPIRHRQGAPGAGVTVCYYDTRSTGHLAFEGVGELSRYDELQPGMRDRLAEQTRGQWLVDEYDADHETRVRAMICRLVVGVVLLVNTARVDKPEAYPEHPRRPEKHGKPRANTHQLKRTITIDLVAHVRDYVTGAARDSPHVTTLVRGHWRNQAHGAGRKLRRATWIEPFWRGEGPLSQRTVRIRGPGDEP